MQLACGLHPRLISLQQTLHFLPCTLNPWLQSGAKQPPLLALTACCLIRCSHFLTASAAARCPLPVRLAPPRFAFQVTPCSLHVTSCTLHTLKNPWRSSSLSLLKILLFPFSVLEIKRKGGGDYKGTALLGFNPILSWWLLFSPLTGL